MIAAATGKPSQTRNVERKTVAGLCIEPLDAKQVVLLAFTWNHFAKPPRASVFIVEVPADDRDPGRLGDVPEAGLDGAHSFAGSLGYDRQQKLIAIAKLRNHLANHAGRRTAIDGNAPEPPQYNAHGPEEPLTFDHDVAGLLDNSKTRESSDRVHVRSVRKADDDVFVAEIRGQRFKTPTHDPIHDPAHETQHMFHDGKYSRSFPMGAARPSSEETNHDPQYLEGPMLSNRASTVAAAPISGVHQHVWRRVLAPVQSVAPVQSG
jgi:hypothetical protein